METLIIAAVIIVFNTANGVLHAQTQAQPTPQPPPPSPPRVIQLGEGNPSGRIFVSFAAAHATYTADFASSPGFGSIRVFFLPAQQFVTIDGVTYRFNTPELLGLENEPIAYQPAGGIQNISVAVMSKQELRSRLTRRPLTSVESNAVVQLRAGKDLLTYPARVFEGREVGRTMGIRAIGSLRAQADCAHCHGVKEGTLLGAFSYALVPTNALAIKTPDAIRPTGPQTPPPPVTPSASATNLSYTLSPNFKGFLSVSSLAPSFPHRQFPVRDDRR